MKKTTVIFLELGMLAGIVVTGYTLPESTPLRTFLLVSGACFVAGNLLLFRKLKQMKSGEGAPETGAWTHIFQAFAILAVFWLLSLVLLKR